MYCANNPINYTDPSGHSAWSVMIGIVGEVLFWANVIAYKKIRQKIAVVISTYQAVSTIYDYLSTERAARKAYGKKSDKYKYIMRYNNFILGVSAVSIAINFVISSLGLSKKIKKTIIYESVKAFNDFGIARSVSWFGISYDAAKSIYEWDRARFKTKYKK